MSISPYSRIEADAEGKYIVIRIYSNLLELSLEIPAVEARRLAAELTTCADITESH